MGIELWDVYDCQGNFTGVTKPRGAFFAQGEYHLVASLWIINSRGEALIQKRSDAKEIQPGLWNITGGAASAGEDSRGACVREVKEEIGFRFDPQDITLLSRLFIRDCIFDDYIITCDCDISKAVLQPEEVSELRWVSIDEILNLYDTGEFKYDDITLLDKVKDYIKEKPRNARF